MIELILGILFLIGGYFVYGRVVEKFIGVDDRETPCVANPDGVDYVPLPMWKNLLIQLLNIAGVGPVLGVILGIKFGKIALIIIPVGCVFLGAVHDFIGGMMSLRMNGANLPKLIKTYLGKGYATVFSWMMLLLLILVVAVFINVPASLIDKRMFPETDFFWWAVAIIFLYYITATLFPVDKIIGKVYPLFGALLILGSAAIFGALLLALQNDPSILEEGAAFLEYKNGVFNANGRSPLFPLLFVTIACGIISGFHATQSPIVARTMKSEKEARLTYYGMMIAEGVIAMIWAASALAIYNINPETLNLKPDAALYSITNHFLGPWMGGVTVVAIVVLAVTSGDTALRSARLSLSEMLSIDQKKLLSRIAVCLPLIVPVALFIWWSNQSAKSFSHIWNYFAWGNQVVSMSTLMAGTVWLLSLKKSYKALVAMLPGMFMTAVVTSFILWTDPSKGQPWGLVPGGLDLPWAIAIGVFAAIMFAIYAIRRSKSIS